MRGISEPRDRRAIQHSQERLRTLAKRHGINPKTVAKWKRRTSVSDAVLEEVAAWQQRPLDPAYPLVFFDAIRVKIRDEGMVRSKAIHIALGARADGRKEVLGLWIEQNEGAKALLSEVEGFWLRVMNELKNRGVDDIMLAVVDGLKSLPRRRPGASPTPLPPCSLRRSFRHASSTFCATLWILYRGKTASCWHQP
jgi:Transposase, Mutator family